MSENYYSALIQHIEALINSNDLKSAKALIDEELSMPFVPKDVLEKLEEYKSYVDGELIEIKGTKIMTPQEVYDCLKSQSEKAYKALETLAMSNIRAYLTVIRDLLEDQEVNHTLKALLIEQLSMQQVNDIIQIVDQGKIINVIPTALPLAINQKNYSIVERKLEQLISSNPTFLQQCKMVLVNVVYDRYPMMINDDEIERVAYSIVHYVYLAYGDQEGFEQFKNTHKINENQLEEYSF